MGNGKISKRRKGYRYRFTRLKKGTRPWRTLTPVKGAQAAQHGTCTCRAERYQVTLYKSTAGDVQGPAEDETPHVTSIAGNEAVDKIVVVDGSPEDVEQNEVAAAVAGLEPGRDEFTHVGGMAFREDRADEPMPDVYILDNVQGNEAVVVPVKMASLEESDGFHLPCGFQSGGGDNIPDGFSLFPPLQLNYGFCGFDVPPPSQFHTTKRCLKVLSLYDGIATGYCALISLGLQVERYYSSEIDQGALQVQTKNFGDAIVQLGDVRTITDAVLDSIWPIDLLLGSAPCQDLSLANPSRRGLYGKDSSGALFFNFVNIKKYLENKAKIAGNMFFWLSENTFSLEKKTKADMDRHLGCTPTKVCSSVIGGGMIRRRYWWGNIPLMHRADLRILRGEPKKLQDYLGARRVATTPKLPTVTRNPNSQLKDRKKQQKGKSGQQIKEKRKHPVVEDGKNTLVYVPELERLFGLPEHYTDCADLSISARRALLGNAWSVHVARDLLLPLTLLYKLAPSS